MTMLRKETYRIISKFRNFSKSSIKFDINTIKIGSVIKTIYKANNPELVPIKYLQPLDAYNSKSLVKHLQWMLQKDSLGQDMFLIGPPGHYRRRLAMCFAELTNREIEYISLSRDTTESDLKQRREIVDNRSIYIDQTALKSALNGRLLILDGIEKTERNVLPILNNLLENREMQLEDGRFVLRADRYDDILSRHSRTDLARWRFLRCSDRFRVIALSARDNRSTPGANPLDPPLRSRFQARFAVGDDHTELQARAVPISGRDSVSAANTTKRADRLVSFAMAVGLCQAEDLPHFPVDNLVDLVARLDATTAAVPDWQLIDWVYPVELLAQLDHRSVSVLNELREKFGLNRRNESIKIAIGSIGGDKNEGVVWTESMRRSSALLREMISIGDCCVVALRGSAGRSMIIDAVAREMCARVVRIALYGDMSARQLLQQRDTCLDTGDTVWRSSALVRAAIEGRWAVLDGLDRLEPGCAAVLALLASDRHLQLFDGSRLLRHDRYDAIKCSHNLSDNDMTDRGIYRIHPEFRIIALADPPSAVGESSTGKSPNRSDWLSGELLASFRFHVMPDISRAEECSIVSTLVPNMRPESLDKLLDVAHALRSSTDPQIKELSHNLSIKQILRISHRLTRYPSETLYNSINRACLSKFLPRLVQDSMVQLLEELNIKKPQSTNDLSDTEQLKQLVDVYNKTKHPNKGQSYVGEDEAKIPNVVFYDSLAHTRILVEMLQDLMMGDTYKERQHLLLIGNQGVGKNKIVDRFLQLLNRPREYIQLHRDTTVQTLTLQPSIRDGKLFYEDSALVKAITKGHILVVDEADKASTQVTCILKILISFGEMELSDGRYIVPDNRDISYLSKEEQEKVIRIHPDFRMIVLANRPGFPFLGNDFFGAMGDVFSCHAVDNPDVTSEISMLQKYGPSVPIDIIKKLVFLFTDLRQLADQDQINYPYSTREIVNIVRHLEKYPNDGLSVVLGNVFDFDVSNKEMMSALENTLEKHGISLPGSQVKVVLAQEISLPQPINFDKWNINSQSLRKLPVVFHSPSEQGSLVLDTSKIKIDKHISRSRAFTELDECIGIRLGDYNIVSDLVASGTEEGNNYQNAFLHFVTLNPIVLTTIPISKDEQGICNKLSSCNHATQLDLSDMFPPVQGSFRPLIHLSALPSPYESSVLLFEASTNKLFQINTETGEIIRISCECLPENKIKLRPVWLNTKAEQKNQKECIKMHRDWATNPSESTIIFHKPGDEYFSIFHALDKSWHSLSAGFPIQTFNMIDKDQWLIQDFGNKLFLVSRNSFADLRYTLQNIDTNKKPFSTGKIFVDEINTSDIHQSFNLNTHTGSVGLGISKDSYVDIIPRLTDNKSVSITRVPRTSPLLSESYHSSTSTVLAQSGIIISSMDKNDIPKNLKNTDHLKYTSITGHLEVVNIKSGSLKYLQIPSVFGEPMIFQWLKLNIPNIFMARLNNDVITLDNTGCIHKWTVCPEKLHKELNIWKSDIGVGADDKRDVMIERLDSEINTDLKGPKHGKIDPTGAPHMGGNTWAGGSGGRDTAGLGGIGGPYRLDGGHNVFQVSDTIKAAVPEHVKTAAREMALKTWKDRLNQIHMSELDYDLYMRYYKRVESQIVAIKSILDNFQATSKERKWIRHRTHGDLDDGKLVEGVIGEKSIYRTRGEKDPEPGSPLVKPKRLRVICDLSGSMYRFNGYDQRLERQMEAILMLMESFVNVRSEKLIYDIYGHSGEGPQFPFVKAKQPPANEKQRMDILSEMLTHSQFCLSGDHTLEAIDNGIKDLRKEIDSVDQSFLVVLSDANLSRYGISAKSVSKLLLNNKEVNSFIIFIGSLGDQAQILKKALPLGHSFVCMDIEILPQILRQIFTTNLLS